MFNYSLTLTNYNWKNALLWGNFAAHCKAASKGSLGNRVVHALIAIAELLPIISQIASIFEKLIITNLVKTSPKHIAAAKLIQKKYREYWVKNIKPSYLDEKIFEKAKTYLNPSSLKSMPKAVDGNASVYLPQELPAVFKKGWNLEERFNKMKQARKICQKNGYKNLVIPQARTCGNYIIETRLPISSITTGGQTFVKEQRCLYLANKDKFTQAIQEFVGFCCQCDLQDARHDNIPLYLDEGHGKIGLIDLEQFSPVHKKKDKDWCVNECLFAISRFPYHYDEILAVASQFDSAAINENIEKLKAAREIALESFKDCQDHFSFIKEKGINIDTPIDLPKLEVREQEKLIESIIQMVRSQNGKRYQFLGETYTEQERNLREFKIVLPEILDLINTIIQNELREKLNANKEPILSDWQLCSLRTIILRTKRGGNYEKFKSFYQDLKSMFFDHLDYYSVKFFLQDILVEFAKQKQIAYCDPKFFHGESIAIYC
jgi:hypothetical protein